MITKEGHLLLSYLGFKSLLTASVDLEQHQPLLSKTARWTAAQQDRAAMAGKGLCCCSPGREHLTHLMSGVTNSNRQPELLDSMFWVSLQTTTPRHLLPGQSLRHLCRQECQGLCRCPCSTMNSWELCRKEAEFKEQQGDRPLSLLCLWFTTVCPGTACLTQLKA